MEASMTMSRMRSGRVTCNSRFVAPSNDYFEQFPVLQEFRVLGVFGVVEVSRLYFGYLGNLSEKVPELASFWLLTLLIQLPLNFLLLFNSAFHIVPLECAMDLMMALFVCFEIIAGYFGIQNISREQEYLFQSNMKSERFRSFEPS